MRFSYIKLFQRVLLAFGYLLKSIVDIFCYCKEKMGKEIKIYQKVC